MRLREHSLVDHIHNINEIAETKKQKLIKNLSFVDNINIAKQMTIANTNSRKASVFH